MPKLPTSITCIINQFAQGTPTSAPLPSAVDVYAGTRLGCLHLPFSSLLFSFRSSAQRILPTTLTSSHLTLSHGILFRRVAISGEIDRPTS